MLHPYKAGALPIQPLLSHIYITPRTPLHAVEAPPSKAAPFHSMILMKPHIMGARPPKQPSPLQYDVLLHAVGAPPNPLCTPSSLTRLLCSSTQWKLRPRTQPLFHQLFCSPTFRELHHSSPPSFHCSAAQRSGDSHNAAPLSFNILQPNMM